MVTDTAPGRRSPSPAAPIGVPGLLQPGVHGLQSDVRHAPPRHLVAAGQIVMSAYYLETWTEEERYGLRTDGLAESTWYLYDDARGSYERTPWSWIAVAPGLRMAAVLEGRLPAPRVGLLDMRTRQVVRWIPLTKHWAGGIAWSPDARRLVVTTYDGPPEVLDGPFDDVSSRSTRSGFFIIDIASGHETFHSLRVSRQRQYDPLGARLDSTGATTVHSCGRLPRVSRSALITTPPGNGGPPPVPTLSSLLTVSTGAAPRRWYLRTGGTRCSIPCSTAPTGPRRSGISQPASRSKRIGGPLRGPSLSPNSTTTLIPSGSTTPTSSPPRSSVCLTVSK